jgi:hypothetical protein
MSSKLGSFSLLHKSSCVLHVTVKESFVFVAALPMLWDICFQNSCLD